MRLLRPWFSTLLIALVFTAPAEGQNSRIGLYWDAEGTQCAADVALYTPTNLYILAHPDPGLPDGGLFGAEFRVKGSRPMILLTSTANPNANISLGNPFSDETLPPGSRGGANIAFPTCQMPDANGYVLLYTVSVLLLGAEADVEFEVDRRDPPSNFNNDYPLINACDSPVFTAIEVSPGRAYMNHSNPGPCDDVNPDCPSCVSLDVEVAGGQPAVCPGDSFSVVSSATNCAVAPSTIEFEVDGVLRQTFFDVPPGATVTNTTILAGCAAATSNDAEEIVGKLQQAARNITVVATATVPGCDPVEARSISSIDCAAAPAVTATGNGPNAACPGDTLTLSVSGVSTSSAPQDIEVFIDGQFVESFLNVMSGQPFATSTQVIMPECSASLNSFPFTVAATTTFCQETVELPGQILVGCREDSLCRPPGGPPDCSQAEATPSLWPPNHKLFEVGIIGVTDPDGDPVTLEITAVTSDEPVSGTGDGNTCADAFIDGSTARLRAERSGSGNGRVYTLHFTATDATGASCEGTVTVCVPRDQSGKSCIQDDTQYDATVCPPEKLSPTSEPQADHRARLIREAGQRVGISFTQQVAGPVQVSIYDLRGRLVRRLADGGYAAGPHTLWWNGTSSSGLRVSSGLYLIRLTTRDREQTMKVVWTN